MDVKTLASLIGTDGKSFRRFLRAQVTRTGGTVGVDTPGRGGAYVFDLDADDADAIERVRDAYTAWRSGRGRMLIALDDLLGAPVESDADADADA